ncbi:MAG: M3 family metallopeptidase, partial [Bacillota bacterium]|nr:M3 family metallopeptidase [Bacillota bacterium]
MEQRWSLKELYRGFDDPQIENDLNTLDSLLTKADALSKQLGDAASFEALLRNNEQIQILANRISAFSSLTSSGDTADTDASALSNRLQVLMTKSAPVQARYSNAIKQVEDIDALIASSDYLKSLDFVIRKAKRRSNHTLSEAEESLLSRLTITGSTAWNKLFSTLVSSLMVDMPNGEQLPITVVRTLASNADPKVRREAYFAELKSYEKVDESIAAALNAIKGEVISTAQLRGYESPLQMTLEQSNMTRATLDAMIGAMKENLDIFRRYLKAKARYLGHKGALPFYDLFAPVGTDTKTYTHKEAEEFVLKSFATFSEKLANSAKTAFERSWIDIYPRKGKVSGAFCRSLPFIGEFRILTNFNGTLGNVTTLAHELGHGYHAIVSQHENPLNLSYPMTLAETASTMCETIVTNDVFNETGSITILDSMLEGAGQVVIDIYSRYLFETKLFETRADKPLSVAELKAMMLEAQKA